MDKHNMEDRSTRLDQKDATPEPKKAPKVDSTLAKGLQILETLAQSNGPRGVSELSRELELTKSNVFRLLQTLSTLGYARPTEDKRYTATLKTWQVGARGRRTFQPARTLRPRAADAGEQDG